MLQSIYIQNYALIDTLDISFTPGFSVITGETGAGKSIILGAIGLLLGQRADIKAIKKGANKCIVEARFNISTYQMEPFFVENDMEYDPKNASYAANLCFGEEPRLYQRYPCLTGTNERTGREIDRRAQPAPKLTAEPRRVSNERTRHTGT